MLSLSRRRLLALNLAEMRAIRDYFAAAGREPTDVELETLAQTWSEHCVHKTFKALIELPPARRHDQHIDGLLRSYIRAATAAVAKPWVRSAFVDNAGIIDFDDELRGLVQGRDPQPPQRPGAVRRRQHRRGRRGARHHWRLGAADRRDRRALLWPAGPAGGNRCREGSLHPRRIKSGRRRRRSGLRQQAGPAHGQRRHPLR